MINMSNMIVILTFLRGDNVNRNNDSVNLIANTTLPDNKDTEFMETVPVFEQGTLHYKLLIPKLRIY